MFDLIAILIPIVLAICIVVVVRIVEDARTRRRLIDADSDPALAAQVLAGGRDLWRRGSLKWGIVAVAVGLAFAAMALWNLDADDPMSYALVFVATGAALLLQRFLDAPRE